MPPTDYVERSLAPAQLPASGPTGSKDAPTPWMSVPGTPFKANLRARATRAPEVSVGRQPRTHAGDEFFGADRFLQYFGAGLFEKLLDLTR
jgi:hypothetical protein